MSDSKSGMRAVVLGLVAVALVLAVAGPASADVGIPMVVFAFPAMLLALVPVIALEALAYRVLLNAPLRQCLSVSALGNATSTVAGVPLAWGFLLVVGMVAQSVHPFGRSVWSSDDKVLSPVLLSGWIYDRAPGWAILVGLIPAFFLSLLLEYPFLTSRWPSVERKRLRAALWFANLASYALLLLTGFFVVTDRWAG